MGSLIDRVQAALGLRKRDPVCGMYIRPRDAAGTSEYGGRTYYFCATGCKHEFDADPNRYL